MGDLGGRGISGSCAAGVVIDGLDDRSQRGGVTGVGSDSIRTSWQMMDSCVIGGVGFWPEMEFNLSLTGEVVAVEV